MPNSRKLENYTLVVSYTWVECPKSFAQKRILLKPALTVQYWEGDPQTLRDLQPSIRWITLLHCFHRTFHTLNNLPGSVSKAMNISHPDIKFIIMNNQVGVPTFCVHFSRLDRSGLFLGAFVYRSFRKQTHYLKRKYENRRRTKKSYSTIQSAGG
ncbi:hypothetical protein JTB14_029915 [Gonioctena quinquepunctata]|nr:hypothetical protein JTB14_029915 [Gonioctena quinquepunctata]